MARWCFLLLAIGMLFVSVSGCTYSREMARMRDAVEEQDPEVRLRTQARFDLGPGSLQTFSWLAGFAPEGVGRLSSDYLHDLRRINVRIYDVEHLSDVERVEPAVLPSFRNRGWEIAVKVREPDEIVWVLYRSTSASVRDFYVLVLNEDELFMARLEGRFHSLLRQVMHDFGPLELQRGADADDADRTAEGMPERRASGPGD